MSGHRPPSTINFGEVAVEVAQRSYLEHGDVERLEADLHRALSDPVAYLAPPPPPDRVDRRGEVRSGLLPVLTATYAPGGEYVVAVPGHGAEIVLREDGQGPRGVRAECRSDQGGAEDAV